MEVCWVCVKPVKRHKHKSQEKEQAQQGQQDQHAEHKQQKPTMAHHDQENPPVVYFHLPDHGPHACPYVKYQPRFPLAAVNAFNEQHSHWLNDLEPSVNKPYYPGPTSTTSTQETPKLHQHHDHKHRPQQPSVTSSRVPSPDIPQIYVHPYSAFHYELAVVEHIGPNTEPRCYVVLVPENASMGDIEATLAPRKDLKVRSRLEKTGKLTKLGAFKSLRDLDQLSLQLEVFDKEMETVLTDGARVEKVKKKVWH
ncbi:hypothetical protein F5Y16DRAFT_366357 [Xylariaceae sp. FL0255]|nr:hypothetical protein F5Y16DRAFT_366357 [Xylariaceae sp. FL0255]